MIRKCLYLQLCYSQEKPHAWTPPPPWSGGGAGCMGSHRTVGVLLETLSASGERW